MDDARQRIKDLLDDYHERQRDDWKHISEAASKRSRRQLRIWAEAVEERGPEWTALRIVGTALLGDEEFRRLSSESYESHRRPDDGD